MYLSDAETYMLKFFQAYPEITPQYLKWARYNFSEECILEKYQMLHSRIKEKEHEIEALKKAQKFLNDLHGHLYLNNLHEEECDFCSKLLPNKGDRYEAVHIRHGAVCLCQACYDEAMTLGRLGV